MMQSLTMNRQLVQQENRFDNTLQGRLYYLLLLVVGVLINIAGIGDSIMEPDGALYATIAKTMLQKRDWINLYVEGKDWLDKPHFPFWLTALSYHIFGISNFGYKFPALAFWALGGWYTWRFARLFYSKEVSRIAILIYLSALHLLISNNDVRAEPYLTGMLIAAIFHFYKASLRKWSWHILAGAAFSATAVMTKGIFILIPIGGALVVQWCFTADWKQFRSLQWGVAVLLTALFITPELWCLYQQFDLHPEKIVFGRTGVSGLRFFFWDSQFGRFLNNGPIKGHGDPFFFLHTLLWAFLPWSLFLYWTLGKTVRKVVLRRKLPEYICIAAGLLCFLLFSASRFQLPHYMNIVFPFFAILCAAGLEQVVQGTKEERWVKMGFLVLSGVLLLAALGLCIFLFGTGKPLAIAWIAGGFLVTALVTRRVEWGGPYLAALTLYGFMQMFFYPMLLRYQSGQQVAEWLNGRGGVEPVYVADPVSYSLDFYLNRPVRYFRLDAVEKMAGKEDFLFYTTQEGLGIVKEKAILYREIARFEHFPVTKLNLKFLRPSTRSKQVQERVLVAIHAPEKE